MVTFSLADLFQRVAKMVPHREALVSGALRMTYTQLDQRSDRVAAALAAEGVGRHDRVAIALRNGPEYLELMLGAFKLSAVPVNVNYRYQRTELKHVLGDSGARVLVHEPEMVATVRPLLDELTSITRTVTRGFDYDAWVQATDGPVPKTTRSDHDRYILYTGGTTGNPKGVVWQHRDIFFAAMGGGILGQDPIVNPDDLTAQISETPIRALLASPLMHGTAHWFAFLTLFRGGSVLLSPEPTLDPARLLDLIDAESASYLVIVGDAIAIPLAHELTARPDHWDLSSLTVILSGGTTLSAGVRTTLLEHLPWIVVVDSYGTSETGGQASAVHAPGMAEIPGPQIFTPRAHTTVLDPSYQPVVPGSGTVGRIARRGHVPVGYHNDPDATAEAFPIIDGERWAITGDHATLDADGRIVFLGRGSTTINSGGEKIHPEEVEAVLRSHPAVYDAVVVGVPDPRWGERVTALVSPRSPHPVVAADLTQHCRAELADFKTPRSVIVVDHVERLESGKPDYRWALRVASGG